MLLAKTMILLAALLAANQPIAITITLQPGAVQSRVAPFDPAMLHQALVRELVTAGIAIGSAPDLPHLVVQVVNVDPGDRLALGQTAHLAVTATLIKPGAQGRAAVQTALAPAACKATAKFGLLSTPSQRARAALARCIDQLAGEIGASLKGTGSATPQP